MELNGSQTKNASCYHSRPNDLLNYYGQVDFRVFRPARTTCCTEWGEICTDWGEILPNSTPIGATVRV